MVIKFPGKIVGVCAFIGMVMGCATSEEQQRSMVNNCYTQGFKRDTPEFSNCLMGLEKQNAASQTCLKEAYAQPGLGRSAYIYSRCLSGK